ncbi:MAG: hypothetical protein ACE5HA_04160 [Anaerolineae bacterium]
MSFRSALNQHFPNAMPESEFVRRTYQALLRHGFSEPNTIACVGVCRDELTRPLVDEIQHTWGEAFNFAGLAGMLFLGKTGFSAAQHHAPRMDGRERYVFFALPHVAIDSAGGIGLCTREGRQEPSHACGALIAFQQELAGGRLSLAFDPDDVEQSLLKQRLFPKIEGSKASDLVALTKLAHEVIVEDLERMIDLTVDPAHSDYAALTGIQVHGPGKTNYIWPGTLRTVVSGQRHDLVI